MPTWNLEGNKQTNKNLTTESCLEPPGFQPQSPMCASARSFSPTQGQASPIKVWYQAGPGNACPPPPGPSPSRDAYATIMRPTYCLLKPGTVGRVSRTGPHCWTILKSWFPQPCDSHGDGPLKSMLSPEVSFKTQLPGHLFLKAFSHQPSPPAYSGWNEPLILLGAPTSLSGGHWM